MLSMVERRNKDCAQVLDKGCVRMASTRPRVEIEGKDGEAGMIDS